MKNIKKLPFFETGKTGTIEFLGVSGTYKDDFAKTVILYKYEGEIIADCKTIIGEEKPILEVLVLESPEEVDRIINGNPFAEKLELKEGNIVLQKEPGIFKISQHGECAFEIINVHNHDYIQFSDKVLNKVILEPEAKFDFSLYDELFDEDEEPIDKMLIFDVTKYDIVGHVLSKM